MIRNLKIVHLRGDGLTSDQIGAQVGLTGARVRQILRLYGLGNQPKTLEQRFLARVQKTESCWLWTGYLDPMGYGRITVETRKVDRAHRVSYRLYVDANLPDAAHILHSCDNPRCVNPAHLRVGTPADNALDRETRERGRTRKLTADQVQEIRMLVAASDFSNKQIAAHYGVHRSTIERIRNGKKWRFLK